MLTSLPPEGFLHIPLLRERERFGEGENRGEVRVGCSCGFWWPYAPVQDLDGWLSSLHPTSEPTTGCTRCHKCVPIDAERPLPPWRRYRAVRLGDGWVYVCRDSYSCQQQQLAAEVDRQAAVVAPDRQDWDWSPVRLHDSVQVSLDDSFETVADCTDGVSAAIALHALASTQVPRSWNEVGGKSARDQRSLLAMVTALSALRYKAHQELWEWVLAARKAGASWEQLVGATIHEETGPLQAEIREMVESYDMDDVLRAELRALMGADDGAAT